MESDFSSEYIAGFFDGEGSIGIYPRSWDRTHTIQYYVLVVSLGQSGDNGKYILTWLSNKFGGCVYKNTQNDRTKVMWKWNVAANKAIEFLKWIQPYLFIKREESYIAEGFQNLSCKRKDSIEATEYYENMKAYK